MTTHVNTSALAMTMAKVPTVNLVTKVPSRPSAHENREIQRDKLHKHRFKRSNHQ